MALNLTSATLSTTNTGTSASAAMHDLDGQRLRILRCTAHAMASSPGGLRFKAGTRPWLDGLGHSASAPARRTKSAARPAAD